MVLSRSYVNASTLTPFSRGLSDNDLIELDALTSRFARLSDILIQKVFRAIDAVELVDEGSLLDRLNRAHRRKIIHSVDDFRNIRELRNQIAHEYVIEDMDSLYNDVVTHTPLLIHCLQQIKEYIEKQELLDPADGK